MQNVYKLLDTAAAANGGMASTISMVVMILVLVGVFYFFLYRPQKKQ